MGPRRAAPSSASRFRPQVLSRETRHGVPPELLLQVFELPRHGVKVRPNGEQIRGRDRMRKERGRTDRFKQSNVV